MSAAVTRQSQFLRTPEDRSMRRVSSTDRFISRSIPSARPVELPLSDTNARYSITYLPGVSEHVIQTGKTLPEAQMKIVMFACEVERLTSLNYELVRENEVLRTQVNKSEREKDLETKLAIVLAENEKLNQVIEELYAMYVDREGEPVEGNQDYEIRIAELIQNLEEWKQRYNTLQSSRGENAGQNIPYDLREQNNRLTEILHQRDSEIQSLKARIEASGASVEVNALEEKIIWLVEQNNKLKEELKNKGPAGDNQSLVMQYRERVSQLMAENEQLRNSPANQTSPPVREIQMKPGHAETAKMAAHGIPGQESQLQVLTKENEELKKRSAEAERLREKLNVILSENERLNGAIQRQLRQIEELKAGQGQVQSTEILGRLQMISEENEKLNNILREKMEEIERLRRQGGDVKNVNLRVDELNVKIKSLLERNNELNNLAIEKDHENDELRRRLDAGGNNNNEVLDDLKGKLILISQENERLNHLLLQKVEEVDKLRKQVIEFSSSNVQTQTFKTEITRLSDTIRINEKVIEDLRRRIHELESQEGSTDELSTKVILISQENERLNTVLEEKVAENERLRRQLYEGQGSVTRIEQMNIQINGLLGENERLNTLLLEKSRENEDVRRRLLENNDSGRIIEDFKMKLQLVTTENERLNTITVTKVREIEHLRQQLAELSNSKIKIDELTRMVEVYKSEIERSNILLIERSTENEALRNKFLEMQGHSSGSDELKAKIVLISSENERLSIALGECMRELNELRGRLQENQGKFYQIELFAQEKEKILIILQEKQRELDEWKKRYSELQAGSHHMEEAKTKISLLVQENEKLNNIVIDKMRESDTLKNSIVNLESSTYKSKDLEERLRLVTSENEKLNRILHERVREIEELRTRLISLESSSVTIDELRSQLVLVRAEVERLNMIILQKNTETEQLTIRISQDQTGLLKSQIQNLLAENEKLNMHLIEKLREIEDMRRRIVELEGSNQTEHLIREGERLQRLLVERDNELNILRQRIVELGGDSARVKDLQDKLILVSSENQRLEGLVESLRREVEKLRNEHHHELNTLSVEVGRHKEELKSAGVNQQRRNNELELKTSQINDLQGKHAQMEDELRKLVAVIGEKDNEINKLRALAGRAEALVASLEQLNNENTHLQELLATTRKESDSLRIKVTMIERLEGELNGLREKLDLSLRQIEEYKKRIYELESTSSRARDIEGLLEVARGENATLKKHLEELVRVNEDLDGKLRVVISEKDRLLLLIEERTKEVNLLKGELTNEKERNRVLIEERITAERNKWILEREQLEKRFQDLAAENEKLKVYLNQVLIELENQRKNYIELENLRSQEVVEFRDQFEILKNISKEIKELQLKSAAERTAYETQLSQFEMAIHDLENQRQMILSENERLTALNIQRLEDGEKHKRKIVESEEVYKLEINELKSQVSRFQSSAHDIKELAIKYSADRAADQSQINQLKALNESLKAEVEKLYELLDQRKNDIEVLHEQNEELRTSQSQLVVKLRQSTEIEGGADQGRFEELRSELHKLEQARNEYKHQAERNSIELTRRNKEFVEKIQDLDVLKLKYEEAFSNCHALNSKLFERLSVTERLSTTS